MFWLNEEYHVGLGKHVTLDGVVCVDAAFGQQVHIHIIHWESATDVMTN